MFSLISKKVWSVGITFCFNFSTTRKSVRVWVRFFVNLLVHLQLAVLIYMVNALCPIQRRKSTWIWKKNMWYKKVHGRGKKIMWSFGWAETMDLFCLRRPDERGTKGWWDYGQCRIKSCYCIKHTNILPVFEPIYCSLLFIPFWCLGEFISVFLRSYSSAVHNTNSIKLLIYNDTFDTYVSERCRIIYKALAHCIFILPIYCFRFIW